MCLKHKTNCLQICAEFARVVNIRADMFYMALDNQLSKLEEFFKANSNVKIRAEVEKFQGVSRFCTMTQDLSFVTDLDCRFVCDTNLRFEYLITVTRFIIIVI